MPQMSVITAIGTDRTGVVHDLTQVIMNCGGNIVESRMTALGKEFAMLMLVSGHWHKISKLENELREFAEESGLTIDVRTTSEREAGPNRIPYAIDVVSLDQEGIVYNLSGFFGARDIEIAEMATRSYPAAHTGAPMFSVQANVNVPANLSIAQLREEFTEFCDHLNLDAILEPVKS